MRGIVIPGTEVAGGWTRVGARLDDLLRVAFHLLCLDANRDPDAEFRRLSANAAWSLSIATAGQLCHVLPLLAREAPPRRGALGAIVAAASAPASAMRRAIATRNTMTHDRPAPSVADLRTLLAELAAWSSTVIARL